MSKAYINLFCVGQLIKSCRNMDFISSLPFARLLDLFGEVTLLPIIKGNLIAKIEFESMRIFFLEFADNCKFTLIGKLRSSCEIEIHKSMFDHYSLKAVLGRQGFKMSGKAAYSVVRLGTGVNLYGWVLKPVRLESQIHFLWRS